MISTKMLYKAFEKFAVDNAPTILTGVGVVGTAATAYLTGKQTFKATKLIADAQFRENIHEKGHELDNKEKLKLVWMCYIPPAVVGVGTIGAIIFANRISAKRAAALAAAYALSQDRFSEYKEKMAEKFGVKKVDAAKAELVQDRVTQNPPPDTVVIVGDGDVLCMDQVTGRYFRSSVEKIKRAQNEINFEILNSGYAYLSDFYERIGLKPTSMSEELGWRKPKQLDLEWSTVLTPDGKPCVTFDLDASYVGQAEACLGE